MIIRFFRAPSPTIGGIASRRESQHGTASSAALTDYASCSLDLRTKQDAGRFSNIGVYHCDRLMEARNGWLSLTFSLRVL